MSHRPIIDAGPSLNFFSVRRERLLFQVVGPLAAPESVQDEVLGKASRDQRFAPAATVWRKLPQKLIEVLPDNPTPQLEQVVQRITSLPMSQRLRQRKDLGELMVVAHAVVEAESGDDVRVLIDDGNGAKTAEFERARLQRMRDRGDEVGSLILMNTTTVLELAVRQNLIADRGEMRDLYRRLRGLDDGLVPIERTELLSQKLWTPPSV
ncbi:hypothetical protein CFP71_27780 [Amycolatopsis thailandensis]|uniref:Uncharacterized protein n=1 Tax=Amycolatopsis thailandensis TaxID=589330 RepID=A0A229RU71_9PSEU|nr:hypothetical protein [Amycolatopsis thailandensis]OXM50237.1 hypothetical protein CFP71_27780 [Amycolatopsis thailandensis]